MKKTYWRCWDIVTHQWYGYLHRDRYKAVLDAIQFNQEVAGPSCYVAREYDEL
jgi:hypothetical protein